MNKGLHPYTVPKAVWKIFKRRNFPSQHRESAGALLENFCSATSKEEVPLAYGKFPSHDFHLIVGDFAEDTGDTGACPSPTVTAGSSAPWEKFLNYIKFKSRWEMPHMVR